MRNPSQECEKRETHEQDRVARIKVSFVKYGIATVTSATSNKRRYSISTYRKIQIQAKVMNAIKAATTRYAACLATHLY